MCRRERERKNERENILGSKKILEQGLNEAKTKPEATQITRVASFMSDGVMLHVIVNNTMKCLIFI